MKVPFLDIGATYREIKHEIDEAIARVLDSGWYVLGDEVEAFEEEFAAYCGVKRAVGVANGLDALIMALRALGVGTGDEVIVPSNTFIASWLAISAVGAIPVPVEPHPDTFNINEGEIAKCLTQRCKAIMIVHLYGQPADIDPLITFARDNNLAIIEDAAQSHGAKYKNRRIGGHGDIVCWSFYPGKNLGAFGDGGAITTNSELLANKVCLLRNYGSQQKYLHETKGVNSRLDSIQAAILRVKLRHLDNWNNRRGSVAHTYINALKTSDLSLPKVPDWADPVWHLFVVRSQERDSLKKHLENFGVGTLVHYPTAPHRQKAYADLNISPRSFPITNEITECVLSLPIGPHLSQDAIGYVIDAIQKFNK